MAQKNLWKLYPKIEGDKNYGFGKISFIRTDTVPANPVEGQVYYDDSENKLKLYNGTSWDALDTAAAAAGTGLDGSYDINNSITVDGAAITFVAGATSDTLQISSTYATASDAALLDLVWTGTPNAGGNMIRIDPSGVTATNSPYAIEFVGTGKDISAMYIDTDSATNHQIYLLDEGNIGAGKSQLYIDNNGTPNATGTLLTLDASGITATNTPIILNIDGNGVDVAAIYIDSDAATDDQVTIKNDGNVGAGKSMLFIDANGTLNATGTLLELDASGVTATNTPIAALINCAGIDMAALSIDSDAATDSAVLINGGGAIADNKALLEIVADGTPAASGSNLFRITATGITATNAPTLAEINGGGKDVTGLWIDADSATGHTVYINNDGNLAAAKSVLYIDYNGTPNATGTLLTLDGTGITATNTPYLMKIDSTAKDAGGLYIDSDAATDSAVYIVGSGAIANNKALLEIVGDGTPANTGSNLLRVDGTGLTATNKPILAEFTGAGKDVIGLDIDTDSVGNVALINGGGNIADNLGVLQLTADGAAQTAGGTVLRVVNSGTPNAGSIGIEGVFTSKDMYGLYMDTAAATNHAYYFKNTGNIGAGKAAVYIDQDGTPNATGYALYVDATGITATNTPVAVGISTAGIDAAGLFIDTDAATDEGVKINGGGAIANDKAVLLVTADGTPANAGSNLVRLDGASWTATNVPIILEILGSTKDEQAIVVDVDGATRSTVSITSSGAVADNTAILEVIMDGTPAAAGSSALRVTANGVTATNTPQLLELDGAGKNVTALFIDADSATNNTVDINNDGNLAAGKSMLYVDYDGTANATGTLLTLDTTGATATNTPYAMKIAANGVDIGALDIDSDAATDSAVLINGGGAVANNKGVLHVTADGAVAAGGAIVRIEGAAAAGGATAYGLEIDCNAANLEGLLVTAGTSSFVEAVTFTAGAQSLAVARTATADGTGTGTIAAGTTYVTVTAGADANSIITLPAPVVGNVIWLYVGATGYELRSSDPATIAINGGSGAGAESAVGANVLVRTICTSATTWVANTIGSTGTIAALEAAAA